MGSKPDYHGAGRWGEIDWDAEHNTRLPSVIPQHARCETCAYWCRNLGGACGLTLGMRLSSVKVAEDRCERWVEHVEWAPMMAVAEAKWVKERVLKYWRAKKAHKEAARGLNSKGRF